jgi:ABC-2 type transport system permease protein
VGAAATKSVVLGLIILLTASLFTTIEVAHPVLMFFYLVLVAFGFSLAGFIIGIWAEGFEELQFIPMLIVTPLTFLGGVFYSIDMLPDTWRTISLFNPIVYIVSGFRWCFYGTGDVTIWISLVALIGFVGLCLALAWWIFRTGYKLKA